jgi:hypothetical protein
MIVLSELTWLQGLALPCLLCSIACFALAVIGGGLEVGKDHVKLPNIGRKGRISLAGLGILLLVPIGVATYREMNERKGFQVDNGTQDFDQVLVSDGTDLGSNWRVWKIPIIFGEPFSYTPTVMPTVDTIVLHTPLTGISVYSNNVTRYGFSLEVRCAEEKKPSQLKVNWYAFGYR